MSDEIKVTVFTAPTTEQIEEYNAWIRSAPEWLDQNNIETFIPTGIVS